MSFLERLAEWPDSRIDDLIGSCGPHDVEAAIAQRERGTRELAALLSPAARPHLEALATEANRLTRRHFGRTVGLYAPLYLSNVCAGTCAYCWFSATAGGEMRRVTLGEQQIRAECEALAARGLRHVLLVSGEAPGIVDLPYLERAVTIARAFFPAVSVEVQALGETEYRSLCAAGIEGVTLYMETYQRESYRQVHLRGGKANFERRLIAMEFAGGAGVRTLTIGALLGLAPWRAEAFRLALHARYLEKTSWRSAVAVAFPRLRHVPGGFAIPAPVEDADLVQMILALRLVLPDAGFAISTRERAQFRDHLIPLGVTRMSAGSSTRPGGYAGGGEETLSQFDIEDRRSAAEVAAAIARLGYDPVWKDFDRAFVGSA
jgi:2-iminoacetate synthase